MGTKEVLHRTRSLGWGTDTHLYATPSEFRLRFPAVLRGSGHRVVKQNRGNGGIGVWGVTLVEVVGSEPGPTPTVDSIVRVQHAARRDDATEDMTLGEFMDRCDRYFTDAGKIIDQPFLRRVVDGMVRAYLVGGSVVGYARQQPAPRSAGTGRTAADRVLGMPSAKTMHGADTPAFQNLRTELEHRWIPRLCALVELDRNELPLLWDADFLLGPPSEAGEDSYLLCEINVSSVLPYPPATPAALAAAVRDRLATGR